MNGRHRKAVPSSIVDGAVPDGRALTAAGSHPFAGWRHVWLALALFGAFAFLATDAGAQIVAGPNANIGGGPACKPGIIRRLPVPGIRRRHDPAAERRIDGVQLAQSTDVSCRRQ